MWYVSSRSGVATLRTAIHLLLVTYRNISLLKYVPRKRNKKVLQVNGNNARGSEWDIIDRHILILSEIASSSFEVEGAKVQMHSCVF